jgi:hypothetical protein
VLSLTLSTPLAHGNIAVVPNRWNMIEHDTLPAYVRLLANPTVAQASITERVADSAQKFRLRETPGRHLVSAAHRDNNGGDA